MKNRKWFNGLASVVLAVMPISLVGCVSHQVSFATGTAPDGTRFTSAVSEYNNPLGINIANQTMLRSGGTAGQQAKGSLVWPKLGDPQQGIAQPRTLPVTKTTAVSPGRDEVIDSTTFATEGPGTQLGVALIGAGGRAAQGCLSKSNTNVSNNSNSNSASGSSSSAGSSSSSSSAAGANANANANSP